MKFHKPHTLLTAAMTLLLPSTTICAQSPESNASETEVRYSRQLIEYDETDETPDEEAEDPAPAGEGELYTLEVGQFTTIQLQDNVNVVYQRSETASGSACWRSTNPEFDNAFIVKNSGGTLKIQLNPEDVNKPDLPVIYVYSDFLNKVLNYNDSTITVKSPAPCPSIELSQVGNGHIIVGDVKATEVKAKVTAGMGTITISGTCNQANLRMTGTGVIQADNLRADNVNCKILGSGTIGCWALNTLTVRGIGSTKIYYKGKPEISRKGGGKIIPLD